MGIRARLAALAIFGAASFLTMTDMAAAASCGQNPTRPVIDVRLDSPKPTYDLKKGIKSLNASSRVVGQGVAAGGFDQTLGLTSIAVDSTMSAEMTGRPQSNGGYCWSISRMTFTVKAETVVYVAKEITRDSCLWREVLAHEGKHVSIAQSFLPKVDNYVRPKLSAALSRSVSARTNDEAGELMKKSVSRAASAALKDFMADLTERQLRLDTPAEYSRFSKACGNAELAAVLKKAGIL